MARLLFGRRTNTYGSRHIVPLFLIAAAIALLAAAAAQPKEKAPDDWVQLNREVGHALQMNGESEADQAVLTEKAEDAVPPPPAGIQAGANTPAADTEAKGGASSGLLDINRATAEQLDSLKGIGPAKAQAIIADREQNGPFQSVDDLLRVKGIGSKLLAGIKDSIVAKP